MTQMLWDRHDRDGLCKHGRTYIDDTDEESCEERCEICGVLVRSWSSLALRDWLIGAQVSVDAQETPPCAP